MTMAIGTARAKLDIGKVFEDVVHVIRMNAKPFFLAALIMLGAPALLGTALRLVVHLGPLLFVPAFIIGLAGLVMTLVLYAGLFYAVVRDLGGSPAPMREFLSVGFKAWLPLLGVGILATLGSVLGLMLLVVPGVILFLRWCIAGPVLVVEGLGVMVSLGRSAALTKGRRWSLFVIFLMVAVVVWVFEGVVFALLGGTRGAVAFSQALSGPVLVGFNIASLAVNIVMAVISSALTATLYHHLRLSRDGLAADTLGQVFD